jgi:hypothetical protein
MNLSKACQILERTFTSETGYDGKSLAAVSFSTKTCLDIFLSLEIMHSILKYNTVSGLVQSKIFILGLTNTVQLLTPGRKTRTLTN